MRKLIAFALVTLLFMVAADAATSPQASIVHTGTTDFLEVSVVGDGTLLNSVLPAVRPRIRMSSGNTLGTFTLAYPDGLIPDTTPPVPSDIQVRQVDQTTVLVSWTTDEFATGVVRYGTAPGTYPNQVADSQYVKSHEFRIDGLTAETVYYFVVGGADLNDNAFESDPVMLNLASEFFTFLPILRN